MISKTSVLLLGMIAAGIDGKTSVAQQHIVQIDWESSVDDGATWRTGTRMLNPTQRHVRIRTRARWDRDSDAIVFAFSHFDAVVRTPDRMSGDAVFGMTSTWDLYNPLGYRVDRFGDLLKMDDSRDSSPPGVGTRWISCLQNPPSTSVQHPEEPTTLFEYWLDLDGQPGLRNVFGVFRVSNPNYPDRVAALYVPPVTFPLEPFPTTISNATILVVPCTSDFDDGTATGTPDGGVTIDDLLFYLALYADGTLAADISSPAAPGTPDGGVTIDDLLYYLQRFEVGC